MDYVATSGLTDISMRGLAEELGTSHRMLSHHFGSKQGLWVAIVQEVERSQREAIAELAPDAAASLADRLRAVWSHLSDPSLWPNERLFFEIYGQALQGQPHAVGLLDGIVDAWVEPVAADAEAQGVPGTVARPSARLGVAVMRGLLLDLLATEDREATDAAVEHWIQLNVGFYEGA